ncbi:MAG: phenylacetate--CoA ligase family protein [Winogradskyella sp.]|uniref:CoF synthetase n=1 Tax=Winogradskyella sp. TaxID=1883156 RepID=UPI0025D4E2F0|nr:CoF synthetase [Winogradskyella sp.]NRB59122.1 phenylacetate--CoA ligase family protein [Winogradskyella sp.]
MLINSLRNRSFWFVDFIKGGKVRSHFKEIELCLKNPNSKEVQKIKSDHLKTLLNHAITTTPFYKDISHGCGIQDFPVVKKTIIQNNFEEFKSKTHINQKNFKVSTSGSTGVPFFLYLNKEKRRRNHADTIYFYKILGYDVGNKLYELKVLGSHNRKSKLKSWVQNIYQLDMSRLSNEKIVNLLDELKSDHQKNQTMIGFASSYETIAQYLEKNNLIYSNLNLNSAVAFSEYLNDYTKKTLSKHLSTPVLSRYSSEEVGIIAQQTLESPDNFIINHASYYVEVLKFDVDEPVKTGELGRIVVTDLFNYAMPIIRYDTGDIAKCCFNSEGIMEFERIEGRKMDIIYDSKGEVISSYVVYTKVFKYYHLLKQYQFIQHGKKEYEVKLNLQGTVFDYEDELITNIKSDFGDDANVKITYVNEIPPLSSGKRRKVINNYRK